MVLQAARGPRHRLPGHEQCPRNNHYDVHHGIYTETGEHIATSVYRHTFSSWTLKMAMFSTIALGSRQYLEPCGPLRSTPLLETQSLLDNSNGGKQKQKCY